MKQRRRPPTPKKKKNKTKQNKTKKEKKRKKNKNQLEKSREESKLLKTKTFSREKKSNPIGGIERRNQITQSPKRFLEISQEEEEEEEAEEKMRMKKEVGCCWFCKETMRGDVLMTEYDGLTGH